MVEYEFGQFPKTRLFVDTRRKGRKNASMRNVIIVYITLVAVWTVRWLKRLIPYSPCSGWVVMSAGREAE